MTSSTPDERPDLATDPAATAPQPVVAEPTSTVGRRHGTRTVVLASGLAATVVLLGGGAAIATALVDDPVTEAGAPTGARTGHATADGGAAAPLPDELAAQDGGWQPPSDGTPEPPDGSMVVPGAGTGPGAGSFGGHADGAVAAVDEDSITVTLVDGSTTDYSITATTQVVLDGEPVEAVDLEVGETVSIMIDPTAGDDPGETAVAGLVLAGDLAGPRGPGGGAGLPAGTPPNREDEEDTSVGDTTTALEV